MQKTNAEILHHFYSLLLEMNFHETTAENSNKELLNDPFVQKHLRQIKLKTAKNIALLKKDTYRLILDEINRLRQMGDEVLRKLLTPKEQLQLQPLFRRFETLSEKDKQSIADDQELLNLIRALKDRIDKSENGNE